MHDFSHIFEQKPEELIQISSPSAVSILSAAADTIGNRASERDQEQERSMKACVESFNAMYGFNLTETHGWMFMVFLKASRAKGGLHKFDDWLDMTAYASLAGECESRTKSLETDG